ncbi:MAG: restriction endonuclease subunit S [Janthinobacterium lividum]
MSLPPNWKTEQLRSNCVKTPLADPTKRPNLTFVYVDVSSVSNESFSIVETKTLLGKDAPSRARKQMKAEDIIFATVRPTLRRVALIPQELDGQVCSTGYCVIRTDRAKLEPAFVYYWLLTGEVAKRVDALQKGATYPAISDSDLLNECLPVPPLPEQHAVAAALRAVQDARDVRRRELVLERERKAALMEDLFTQGLRKDDDVRMTKYGLLPTRWVVKPLAECADVQTGAAKGRDFKGTAVREVPYLRVANVQDGYLDLAEMKTITIRESEVDRYRLRIGDVVLTEGGDFDKLGRGFVWSGQIVDCIHQNHVFAVRGHLNMILPHYFAYLAASPYGKSYFLAVAHKTTNLACINTTKLKAFPVPLPPLTEQHDIAEVLTACDSKIASLEAEAALQDELFRALLEELMTGRLSAIPLISELDAMSEVNR